MKTLVTGGTGFVGVHLAQALLDAGHDVAILGRNFAPAQSLIAAGALPVAADLRDAGAVQRACSGMDAVFHVGALSAPWGAAADFQAINVGGTRNVVHGCTQHGVQRLILVSSPSVVFNGRDQQVLTEAAPYPRRFASIYSETKKQAEDVVRAAAVPWVIVRPKAIFGPGDTTLLPRLITAARQGRLPQIGAGHNLVDLTYVANVVDALVLSLTAPAAVGRIYNITNDEHVPLWTVIRTVLARLGIRHRLRRVPVAVALLLARLLEAQAAWTGREPALTRYGVAVLARTQTYTIAAARRDLGYNPRISVADGIERVLQALQSSSVVI